MKKLVTTITIILFIFATPISYSLEKQPGVDKPKPAESTIKMMEELNRISDDLSLTYSIILSGKYDSKKLVKDIEFLRTRINSVLHNAQLNLKSSISNPLESRELESIQYIASGDLLASSGIVLYLQDPTRNQDFLFDSISAYNDGKKVIEEIEEEFYKVYGIKIGKIR